MRVNMRKVTYLKIDNRKYKRVDYSGRLSTLGRVYTYNKKIGKEHTQYRIKRLIKIKALLGGKCNNCGYDKNWSALDIHHLNGKNFPINTSTVCIKPWEELIKESKKTILLCGNCHREIHHPHLSIHTTRGGLAPKIRISKTSPFV